MPFKPLLELRVEHPFYEAGRGPGARLVPEPSTEGRLRGLRLLPRSAPGSLVLIGDFTDGGETRVPLPEASLLFRLELERELLLATDLSRLPPGSRFTDDGAGKPMKPGVPEARLAETIRKPAGAASLVLAGRPLAGTGASAFRVLDPAGVSVTDFDEASRKVSLKGPQGAVTIDYPVAPPTPVAAIAWVEIAIGPAIAAKAAAGKPPSFRIVLEAAAAPWCYHLVTDLPNPLAEWRIDHPASDGPPAAFGAASVSEIAAADPADRFGSDLLMRSAPFRVLRFVSNSAVPCSETPARRMTLFAGDRQLFTALPNPSPAEVRLLNGKPAFGEVLRFVTA